MSLVWKGAFHTRDMIFFDIFIEKDSTELFMPESDSQSTGFIL